MRFCPWYPLAEASAHAPPAEGVLQLRIAGGLLDYPRGKSAMVHYEYAADVCAAATALAARHEGQDLLCRHLESDPGGRLHLGPGERRGSAPLHVGSGDAVDVRAFHAKVLDEFVRRFGSPPVCPLCTSSKPKP